MTDMTNPTPPEFNDGDYALLSAYIDDQLSDSERQFLEARLVDDEALRAELAALRQTVAWLNTMPQLKAPRDFTLSEADIAHLPKPNIQLMPRRNPIVYLAGAAAAVLIVVVGIGVIFTNTSRNAPTEYAAPAAQEIALVPTATLQQTDTTQNRLLEATSVQQSADDSGVAAQSQGGMPLQVPDLDTDDEEAGDVVPVIARTSTTEAMGAIASEPILEEDDDAPLDDTVEDGFVGTSESETSNVTNLQGQASEADLGEQALPNLTVTTETSFDAALPANAASSSMMVEPEAPEAVEELQEEAEADGDLNLRSQQPFDALGEVNFRTLAIRIVMIVLQIFFGSSTETFFS